MLNGDVNEEPPTGRPETTRRRSKSNLSSKNKLRRRDHNSSQSTKLAHSERPEKKGESIESLSLSFFEKVREPDETNDCSTIREGDLDGLQVLALENREHTIREADPTDLKAHPPSLTSSNFAEEKKKRRKRSIQTQRSSSSALTSRAHRSQTVFEVPSPDVPSEALETLVDALGQKLLAELRGQQEETRAAMQAIIANQSTIIQMLNDKEELTQALTKTQNVLASVVMAYASPKHQAPAALETTPQDALISSHISILNEETHRLKQRLRETSELVTELQEQVEQLRS